jgi:ADP-ribose pyrophosphatase YjhB (NUDIX family)
LIDDMSEPRWLEWAKQLQAISQIGLAYSKDPYDKERFEQIRHIAAEILTAGTNAPFEKIHGLMAAETGYATPKVDTRGVVFRDDLILLVREREDNRWTLPGGWADVLESPAESVVREVREESGYDTKAVKILAVYDRNKHAHVPLARHHIYKLFFRCELTGGSPSSSLETVEAAFFPEGALPELSLARVTPAQIIRLFEHYRNPELPADFD